MSSTLELDQDDMAARLSVDEVTGLVTVFAQRKGITENDIQTRLGALNSAGGQVGLVLIVLMPKLIPQEANTPAPMYYSRYTVQVIDWPAVRRQPVGGIEISAESMAERVRQILHAASFGRGQSLYFDGLDPIALADPNQISYLIHFKKVGADDRIPKVANVLLIPQTGDFPQTVTITCPTAGAAIWYTTDGSYPSSLNPTATLYSGPIAVSAALTVRAAAQLAGRQPGDPAQGVYTAPIYGPLTIPQNLAASAVDASSCHLTWDASSGGTPGVDHYQILQDGSPIGTASGLAFDVGGLTPDTMYSFTVRAVDSVPNFSGQSDPAVITTAGAIDQTGLLVELAFDEGSGRALTNKKAPDISNMFPFPEGPFPSTNLWGGATFGPGGQADPNSGTRAWRAQLTAGNFWYINLQGFTIGLQYTFSVWLRSRTGVDQTGRLLYNGGGFTPGFTITPAWQRFEKTFTAADVQLLTGVADDGASGLDVDFYGMKMELGAASTPYLPASGNFVIVGPNPNWDTTDLDFYDPGVTRWAAANQPALALAQVTIHAVVMWPLAAVPPEPHYLGIVATKNADEDQINLSVGGGWGDFSIFPAAKFKDQSVRAIGGILHDEIWHLVSFVYDGTDLRYYIDGALIAFKNAPGLTAPSLEALWLSNMGFSGWFPGRMAYLTFYNAAHNAAKVRAQVPLYNSALAARGGIVLAIPAFIVAAEGDSITNGTGLVPYTVTATASFPRAQGHVFAIPGNGMTEVEGRASEVDALMQAGVGSFLTLLIGANDYPVNAATYVARIAAYCNARRAAGWLVIICTITPKVDAGFNTFRAAVNTLIRADTSFYDGLADFAADPVMGPDAAAADITLYGDTVHPTQLGQNNLAAILVPVITALLP